MKYYEVWCEGYSCTGESAPAYKAGEVKAASFAEACQKLFHGRADFNPKELTLWACRLYDNEKDARKLFG
jgi:hypothetical protein